MKQRSIRIVLCGLAAGLAAPLRAEPAISGFPPDMQAIRAALRDFPAPGAPASAPGATRRGALPDSIWYQPPISDLSSPESREYAQAAAAEFARPGGDFSSVFAAACRHLLDSPRAAQAPKAELTNLFRGLILWTRGGARPLFQGRHDWPMHFIYGGYIALKYGYTAADMAAYSKEQRDSTVRGNFFDLGDYAATMLGARWAVKAGGKPAPFIAWVRPWALGQKTLDSIPPIPFGPLPKRTLPSEDQFLSIRAFLRDAFEPRQAGLSARPTGA